MVATYMIHQDISAKIKIFYFSQIWKHTSIAIRALQLVMDQDIQLVKQQKMSVNLVK